MIPAPTTAARAAPLSHNFPNQFKGTIVFVMVAGEEQGLYGSAFMAKVMKAAAVDVQGMFSNDIVGASSAWDGTRPDPLTVRLFIEGVPTAETAQQTSIRQSVGGENDCPSRQLARFVKDVAENDSTEMTVRMIWRRDRYLRGSDHLSFLQQGYPAARFTEPRENDLPEFCDFGYISSVTKVNAATLFSLAKGPGTPKGLGIVAAVLTNTTTLNWTADTDPDIEGYEVVWRETTSPLWTHAIDVGNVSTATIDLSKDNVQFGLRAVDHSGRRSPGRFPCSYDVSPRLLCRGKPPGFPRQLPSCGFAFPVAVHCAWRCLAHEVMGVARDLTQPIGCNNVSSN